MTTMATIKIRDDGPCLVDGGDVRLVDAEGAELPIPRRPFALCRCGHSANKPFCDGAHNREGFDSKVRAGSRESAP